MITMFEQSLIDDAIKSRKFTESVPALHEKLHVCQEKKNSIIEFFSSQEVKDRPRGYFITLKNGGDKMFTDECSHK